MLAVKALQGTMVPDRWRGTHVVIKDVRDDVHGLGVEGQEVRKAPALVQVVQRGGLGCVYQVWDLLAVPDEEHLH